LNKIQVEFNFIENAEQTLRDADAVCQLEAGTGQLIHRSTENGGERW
jgi:hypothetical protein